MNFKKSNSVAARDTFLDRLAEAIAKGGDQKKELILKMLKTLEFVHHTNR
jgi:hypothetical protein